MCAVCSMATLDRIGAASCVRMMITTEITRETAPSAALDGRTTKLTYDCPSKYSRIT